jgi:hypothetical protein
MRLPLLLSALALLPLSSSDEHIRDILGNSAPMRATPVALSPSDPALIRAGALVYLGGLQLTSRDRAFGGFSAIAVDGDQFTLISDAGNIVRFRMGKDLRPFALAYGDLPGPGTGWRKLDRDAESLTRDPASGRMWVGFEGTNAIWRYDSTLGRVERAARPRAMRKWQVAGGAEAMVRLRDGAFLVFSEQRWPMEQRNARVGLRFAGDPTEPGPPPMRFAYVPPPGYNPVDVAELPDGRLLMLNRDFSPRTLFTAKLTIVDLNGLSEGATLHGREIATLAAPLLHDNFEGIAVTREKTETIVWIVSDDNSQFWEKSLLLKFRLALPSEPEKGN